MLFTRVREEDINLDKSSSIRPIRAQERAKASGTDSSDLFAAPTNILAGFRGVPDSGRNLSGYVVEGGLMRRYAPSRSTAPTTERIRPAPWPS